MAAERAPALELDPLVVEAANRAFADLAGRWYSGGPPPAREELLAAAERLGFAGALSSPDGRDEWPNAAAIIRAQARAAAPVDMALLLATGERAAAIAYDPEDYACAADVEQPAPAVLAALSLGRCLQIGAALEAALELSLRYVQDRRQFGRALAQFQAIQHSLAIAAEEVAACAAITDFALAQAAREDIAGARLASMLDAAALVAARAVDVVCDACHQVHGAIGFTREYALGRHTLDVLRWREHLLALRGGEIACAERLGDAALGAGGLWRSVVSLMHPGGPR
jgi:alkylation response protein AidB-like acyl-CoA dehydrogenase